MPDVKIKKDGQEYDIGVIPLHYPADRVTYINTDSGLSADNAQDAIDELAIELDGLLTYRNVTTTTQTNGAFQVTNSYTGNLIPIGFKVTTFPEGYSEVGGYFVRGGDGLYYLMLKDASGNVMASKEFTIQIVYVKVAI